MAKQLCSKLSIQLVLLVTILAACSSRREVAEDYHELLKKNSGPTSQQTVIIFLIDGLPLETLNSEINNKKLPQIEQYFIGEKKIYYKARTIFPSLTFPSISSLLTGLPIDQTGIYGNTIFQGHEKVSFEDPTGYPILNHQLAGKDIFARLKKKGLRTVSLDYVFQGASDAATDSGDIKAGRAILDKNYSYVDFKTIDSLKLLLKKTSVAQWPDFIFVHLVGVDLTSHDLGPQSVKVRKYLEALDSRLKETFKILQAAESQKKRRVVSMLTADHGFDEPVTEAFDIEDSLYKINGGIRILNEGRYAAVVLPKSILPDKARAIFKSYANHAEIDITAYHDGDNIFIYSQSLETTLHLDKNVSCLHSQFQVSVNGAPKVCPGKLDEKTNSLYYPFFLANISHYFNTDHGPDAILITKPGKAFSTQEVGQHGGPTPQEIFVPLLIHNGALANPNETPALSELLDFL